MENALQFPQQTALAWEETSPELQTRENPLKKRFEPHSKAKEKCLSTLNKKEFKSGS